MAKKPLSPEARSIINSKVSRRAVLAGAGAVAGASALAACGSGGGSSENAIRWGNWPLYLDVDDSGKNYPTLQAFIRTVALMLSIWKITTIMMSSLEKFKLSLS